jgi:hypothetical protein
MPAYQLALVIADIISAHCPGTSARQRFLKACISTDWDEAASMVEGMLAEPWHLRGRQERRLREFLELISDVPAQQPRRYAKWYRTRPQQCGRPDHEVLGR